MKMDEHSSQYSPSSHLVSTFTASSSPASPLTVDPFSTAATATFPPLRIPFTQLQLVIISLIFAALSLITVAGNLFVIAAFRTEPSLRMPHNYFLLSLAVADLAVGAVSLPFFGTYVIYGYRWPMGSLACDLWLALDYTMSSASAASLLLISLDRYYSIISPLAYRSLRTRKRVCIVIMAAWITAGLVWCPGIFGYPYIYGSRIVPYDDCYIQFLKTNSFLTVVTALFAFFIPVCIMMVLYFRIWRVTEKRKKDLKVLMAIRPADRSSQNSRRLKYSRGLKKTQYFKLHCLKLRQTLKNSATRERPISSKNVTNENDKNLEIQEIRDRISGLNEAQSPDGSEGSSLRFEPATNLKKHRNLKNIQTKFNCLKLNQSLKNRTTKSTKRFPNAEVKTSELMELNFQEQPEDRRRFKLKLKPNREIQRMGNLKDIEKRNPKISFNCLNLRKGLTKRKMCTQSIRDFQSLKTKEFELHGTDFSEVQSESENVKLKTSSDRNSGAEALEKASFSAKNQKLNFNYLDLPGRVKVNKKMKETFLKDDDGTGLNDLEEGVVDFGEEATEMLTESAKLKIKAPQESCKLSGLKKMDGSQDETLNRIELSECFKCDRQRQKRILKSREVLDVKKRERLRETCGHFNCLLKSDNFEMFTVEGDGDLENFRSSLKISNDYLPAMGTSEMINVRSTSRDIEPIEQGRDVSTPEGKEVIMVSVITNESGKGISKNERLRKTIKHKDETTKITEDNMTVSKTATEKNRPHTSFTESPKHNYSTNVNDTISVNKGDLSCHCFSDDDSLAASDNIKSCIEVSTAKGNKKNTNVTAPSNCPTYNLQNLQTKGSHDDDVMKSAQQTNPENTSKRGNDLQTKCIINKTKATSRHKNNQRTLQTNHIHKKSTKKQLRKKRPINKLNQRRPRPSTAKSGGFPRSRYFEDQGEIYTILINIPRGEGMGRPSIRLVGGSVGFDQWNPSVDRCENLNLKGRNEYRNMTINEWEESDSDSDSESEMIEVWEEEEEEEEEDIDENECENLNMNEWVDSEGEIDEIIQAKQDDKDDANEEIEGLSGTSLEADVLTAVSRKVTELAESNNYQNDNANDDQYERVVTSLRETSSTIGTGTGSDTIETEPGTEDVTPSTSTEKGQKWRRGHSTHRRMRIPDRKAAKTLSAILLVFIITWLPYNVLALLQAFCDNCVNETLYAIGYWLCYLNSTINPLCYALCNANFRKAFIRIVTCQRRQYQLHPGIYAHRGLHKRGHLPV